MIVKLGFNTDFGRDKFDVGLDETDLARILEEAHIPVDAKLTSTEVFQILRCEAEKYCRVQMARIDPSQRSRCEADIANLNQALSGRLAKIRERIGLEPDEQ